MRSITEAKFDVNASTSSLAVAVAGMIVVLDLTMPLHGKDGVVPIWNWLELCALCDLRETERVSLNAHYVQRERSSESML